MRGHLTLNRTFNSRAMRAHSSSDSWLMEPPTTETVTPEIISLHSLMNSRTAGYASAPNDGLLTSWYSSELGALRLIDTESMTPSISDTMSLPLIRLPRPLVSRRTGLPNSALILLAHSSTSSNRSVGSPYPQKTTSLDPERSTFLSSSITSSTVGSRSSQRESASPSLGVESLTQNTHLQGHLLVMLM